MSKRRAVARSLMIALSVAGGVASAWGQESEGGGHPSGWDAGLAAAPREGREPTIGFVGVGTNVEMGGGHEPTVVEGPQQPAGALPDILELP